MQPVDLHVDEMSFILNAEAEPSVSSEHRVGVNVLFVDGTVKLLRDDMPPESLRAMTTKAGGD